MMYDIIKSYNLALTDKYSYIEDVAMSLYGNVLACWAKNCGWWQRQRDGDNKFIDKLRSFVIASTATRSRMISYTFSYPHTICLAYYLLV